MFAHVSIAIMGDACGGVGGRKEGGTFKLLMQHFERGHGGGKNNTVVDLPSNCIEDKYTCIGMEVWRCGLVLSEKNQQFVEREQEKNGETGSCM